MKVGILGAGQLAQMLVLAGVPLGIEFVIYSPLETALTEMHKDTLIAPWDDTETLQKLISESDIVTFETENIPLGAVEYIANQCETAPNAQSLIQTQDRLLEKNLFRHLNIPTNAFFPVNSAADLSLAAHELQYPFMIKSRRSGYDGKHQWKIDNERDLQNLQSQTVIEDCLAESFVAFDYEISLIAVADVSGNTGYYDVCLNVHEQGILRSTHNQIQHPLFEPAKSCLQKLITHLNYVGVITVEFFVKDNTLFANEIAPRVHNSGHWTIEGSFTSQFENHLRAICNLPLGSTKSKGKYVMNNIIGEWPNRHQLFAINGLSLHDYQKQPQPNRKLGHTTTPLS